MIPKPITSADIDRHIQEMGIRLAPDQDRLRERALRELQMRRDRQTEWQNNRPPVPMFLFDTV